MKVKELKELLDCFEEDDVVLMAYPSGDYWGSVIGQNVYDVDYKPVKWSEYHRAYKVYDEEPADTENIKHFLVITGV